MNIKHNKDPYNRYDVWEFSVLTIKKEMVFSNVSFLEKVVSNLEKLQEEKFYNVVVPDFSYFINDHILSIEMDYVKGDYIRSIHHYNVVYDELIERESDYSWTDYSPQNFIVKDDRVHVIDLDSYGFIQYEDRKKKWEKQFGIFAPLIRSYRGNKQLDAKLSCDNLSYIKLKRLLENVFNAKVERVEEDYFAKIDNSTYDNLESVMSYLKLLYSYLQNEMDLNPPRHQQRKDILKELR
tara:strand:+ start:321 stop:1034 length:714 start_codon:yes stop_codon:yes gene_type:complete